MVLNNICKPDGGEVVSEIPPLLMYSTRLAKMLILHQIQISMHLKWGYSEVHRGERCSPSMLNLRPIVDYSEVE